MAARDQSEVEGEAARISDMKMRNKELGERILRLQQQLSHAERERNAQLAIALAEAQQQQQQQQQQQPHARLSWYVKAKAKGFRSNPLRLPDRVNSDGVSICRPHNYRLIRWPLSHVTRHTSHVTPHTCPERTLNCAMHHAGVATPSAMRACR